MMETMKLSNGIGLSAVQVGKPICVLVFDTGQEFGILINPVIIAVGGEAKIKEGCLSLPGKQIEVDRYSEIKVRYHRLDGKLIEREFYDLSAIVVQHEYSHFFGKLITDKEPNQWD